MKKLVLLACLLAIIGIFACQSEKKVASSPLSMEQTAQILSSQIVADASITNAPINDKDSLTGLYYKQIFEIHQTNLETYDKALEFFSKDPKEMEKLYNLVDTIFAHAAIGG